MKLSSLTKEQIINALKSSKTLTNALDKLNAVKNGGNRAWLRKFIVDNNLDVSHFIKVQSKKEYEENPKYCKQCGKKIDWKHRENDFCSHSCATLFNNKLRNKINEVKVCVNCGKLLNSSQVLYCSHTCQQEYQNKKYIDRWKNGLEDGLSGEYNLSDRIRNYLLNKTNCKCELCGWGKTNQFTNRIPLEIHHKDGNYMNNKEDNLQVLCPNCHSLTETFKSHNKSGRKSRNKYY